MTGEGCGAVFSPAADPALFRKALGRFATGVTVVTACDGSGPVGMTANSFASVSLSPPLVLWSVAKSSMRHDIFANCETCVINILSADQGGLAQHFVRQGRDFASINYQLTQEGVPILDGCAASFHCKQHAAHDTGDHTILIAGVMQARMGDQSALIFSNGSLRPLTFQTRA